jgi:carbon-monoxide dehydrogenase catalytic subunit
VVGSGIFTVLGIAPPIFGSPNIVKLLTEGLEGVFGATFAVEPDPNRAAVLIRRHIEKKRLGLNLPAVNPDEITMPEAELALA